MAYLIMGWNAIRFKQEIKASLSNAVEHGKEIQRKSGFFIPSLQGCKGGNSRSNIRKENMTEKNIKGSVAAYKANCTRRVMNAQTVEEERRIRNEYDKKIKDFLKANGAWEGKKSKKKMASCGHTYCRISNSKPVTKYEVYEVKNGARVFLGSLNRNPMW